MVDHASPPALPPAFQGWFQARGWQPHPHQLAMLAAAEAGRHALLIAPTGGGKTLAGFLPSLVDLAERPRPGLHTLYISPLKALSVDIHRNLERPLAELRLPIRAETRTGDTPQPKRDRQRREPPHILMTTPESLALMLSLKDQARLFAGLACVIVDELHALAGTKRGDLLALALARLATLAPSARRVALSATVADEPSLLAWVSPTGRLGDPRVALVRGAPGPDPLIEIAITGRPDAEGREHLPWAGHMGTFAIREIYRRIQGAGTTLVFVNTRAQAELIFQGLWRINEADLPIALHHGSLAVEQRRRVEAAMAAGGLRAVVATSSLDLGIDWGAVDLVIQIGAPKGAARLLQRIGRANHRFDAASRAVLVPANRFEVLECTAAIDAIAEGTLDGDPILPGGLDVLAQHLLGMACTAPFHADEQYRETVSAAPYAALDRATFDAVLDYVATGGYALAAYERYRRLKQLPDGRWAVAHPAFARQYRMNVGTIVEAETLKVRYAGKGAVGMGPVLGEVEEYFVNMLAPGDTFLFAGELLTFVGVREMNCLVLRGAPPGRAAEPKVPAYAGGRLPLTTHLADRVRARLAAGSEQAGLPPDVAEWLQLQERRSVLPPARGLLVESFARNGREYLVAYCFEGRNAHQTLGMLVTRRMERLGLAPLGFVGTDYVLATWGLRAPRPEQVAALFAPDLMGDDLEEWMAESSLLRRTFRRVAVIAGLIERNQPRQERRTGRAVTINSDLIYDVLRQHQPDHVLLRATRADAARGLTDIKRLSEMLGRVEGRILFKRLPRVSPLAVPVILEIGREQVYGEATDAILEETAAALIAEATGAAEEGPLVHWRPPPAQPRDVREGRRSGDLRPKRSRGGRGGGGQGRLEV